MKASQPVIRLWPSRPKTSVRMSAVATQPRPRSDLMRENQPRRQMTSFAPDDPKMQDLIKVLRRELEQGLREREQKMADDDGEGDEGGGDQPGPRPLSSRRLPPTFAR